VDVNHVNICVHQLHCIIILKFKIVVFTVQFTCSNASKLRALNWYHSKYVSRNVSKASVRSGFGQLTTKHKCFSVHSV